MRLIDENPNGTAFEKHFEITRLSFDVKIDLVDGASLNRSFFHSLRSFFTKMSIWFEITRKCAFVTKASKH